MAADPQTDHAIVNARLLPWPCARVWAEYHEAARLAAWWGPAGFTNTFHEFDFRPGGAWRFTMHAPDGAAYEMTKRFVEIVPRERIVVCHSQHGHGFTLTMFLAAEGAGTRLTWRMLFDDPAEAGRVGDFVHAANEQNFDRLEAQLRATP